MAGLDPTRTDKGPAEMVVLLCHGRPEPVLGRLTRGPAMTRGAAARTAPEANLFAQFTVVTEDAATVRPS